MTRQNGFAIRGFRQAAGITVSQMADVAGVSPAHYRKLEAETREAQPEQLARIARAVNQPVAALVRTPPDVPQIDDAAVLACGVTLSGHPGMVRA